MAKVVTLAGKKYQLERTNLAAYRRGGLPYGLPEYKEDAPSDQVLRWYVIMGWSFLVGKEACDKFPAPEDLAEALAEGEVDEFTDAVLAAIKESNAAPAKGKGTRKK